MIFAWDWRDWGAILAAAIRWGTVWRGTTAGYREVLHHLAGRDRAGKLPKPSDGLHAKFPQYDPVRQDDEYFAVSSSCPAPNSSQRIAAARLRPSPASPMQNHHRVANMSRRIALGLPASVMQPQLRNRLSIPN